MFCADSAAPTASPTKFPTVAPTLLTSTQEYQNAAEAARIQREQDASQAADEAAREEKATIGGSVGGTLVLVLTLAFYIWWRRRPKIGKYGVQVINFDDLTMGKFLGKGAFGNVNMAIHQGTDVAIKLLEKENEESLEDLDKEIYINTLLPPHPNVVKMLGMAQGSKKGLIMELYPLRAVDDYRKAAPAEWAKLGFDVKIQIGIDVSAGLVCMHENRVIHRCAGVYFLLLCWGVCLHVCVLTLCILTLCGSVAASLCSPSPY